MDVRSLLTMIIGVSIDTLLVFFYLKNFTIKYRKAITAAAYCGYWLLSFITGYGGSTWLRSAVNFVLIMILAGLLYQEISVKSAIKLTILCHVIIYISELIVIPLSMLFTKTYDIKQHFNDLPMAVSLLAVFFSRLIAFLFLQWIAKKEQRYRYDQLSRNELFIIYGLLGVIWALLLLTGDFFLLNNRFITDRDSFISLLIIVVIAVFFVVVYISFIDNYLTLGRKNKEIGVLQQRIEMQGLHHRHMTEDLKNLQMLQHDLKNHLLLAGKETDYVSKILEKIEESDKYIETGNEMLDILLFEKNEMAHQMGINVEIFLTAKDINFLDELDICSIFGNIFDNAIEACEKLGDQTDKTIELKVTTIRDFLMIILVNDCLETGKTIKGSQLIKTTKKQKEFHGIGLVSLKNSVEKYGGSCQYEQNGRKFKTKIIIPVPAKTD